MNPDQVRVIERLRDAAREHGEVYDLLVTLRDSLLLTECDKEIIAIPEDLEYLKAAMMAADFAEYDKEN